MYTRIERELSDYEQSGRYRASSVIHGDPVFSNVLLTKDGRIFLLDMRGELGSVLTLQGDLAYDLSKVYQSLLGYDFIILGQPLHERDAELLEELRHTCRSMKEGRCKKLREQMAELRAKRTADKENVPCQTPAPRKGAPTPRTAVPIDIILLASPKKDIAKERHRKRHSF